MNEAFQVRFWGVQFRAMTPTARAGRNKTMTILGVDPGSLFTGFGAVRATSSGVSFLSFGVIAPPKELSFVERIGVIADEYEMLLEKINPDVTVIEKVFLGKNADSAFKLGHARGVAVAATVRAGSEVVEYATRVVKKGITGNGGATKEQVQVVLAALLGIKKAVRADASDALALAYYHASQLALRSLSEKQGLRRTDREIDR